MKRSTTYNIAAVFWMTLAFVLWFTDNFWWGITSFVLGAAAAFMAGRLGSQEPREYRHEEEDDLLDR